MASNAHRQPTVAIGRVQLRRMASATATRMVEAVVSLCFLQMGEEFFEILDGDAARGAAAGQAGQVGGVQAQFVHARFHARATCNWRRRRWPGTGSPRTRGLHAAFASRARSASPAVAVLAGGAGSAVSGPVQAQRAALPRW